MPTRRKFLTTTVLASGAALTPRLSNAAPSENKTNNKLKIMVVGAHPDDPELWTWSASNTDKTTRLPY